MRMSELARGSGLTVATIKYYLREGLLQPGHATARTQAEYGQDHLDRLKLVRALVEVGRLPLATVRAVVTALGNPDRRALGDVIGTVYSALPPHAPDDDAPPTRALATMSSLGWQISPDAPALRQLESALASVEAVGLAPSDETLRVYGAAALDVASNDVANTPSEVAGDVVRHMVVGTVLYEPVQTSLRRLAIQHVYVSQHPDEF